MPEELSIIVGGDTVPTESNEYYLANQQEEAIFSDVRNVLLSVDLAIINLECPLTHEDQAIKKAGPNLKANPQALNGLLNAGITVFSLANNHIMDYGVNGLRETIVEFRKKNVFYTGAGENLAEARKVLILEKKGRKIAIISVAEHEFSIATENSPGANPFDPIDTLEDIEKASATADLTIVLYHGGIEYYRLPSPNLQRICRKMIEKGATHVICQHSHCIGAYEQYLHGQIVYGQGNFLFDYMDSDFWQTGLLIKIVLENSRSTINFFPIVKKGCGIQLADAKSKESILKIFNERNKSLLNKEYIQTEWQNFCKERQYHYLQAFLGFGRLLRKVDNRLNNAITKLFFREKESILLNNYINCESHLDVIKNFLGTRHLR